MSETIPSLTPNVIVGYVCMICEAAASQTLPIDPGCDAPVEQRIAYVREMNECDEYEDHCLCIWIKDVQDITGRRGYAVVIGGVDESHDGESLLFIACNLSTTDDADDAIEVQFYTPGPWLIHLQTLATHAGTVPDPAGVRHERKCAAHRARARAYSPQRRHRCRAARAGPRY